MYRIILILMIVLSESIGQYFIKKYNQIPKPIYYIYGIFFYLIVIFILSKVYSNSPLGIVQLLWSGLSVLSVLIIGHFIFGEEITSNEWIGIILIISGIVITQIKTNIELWLSNGIKHEIDIIKKHLS